MIINIVYVRIYERSFYFLSCCRLLVKYVRTVPPTLLVRTSMPVSSSSSCCFARAAVMCSLGHACFSSGGAYDSVHHLYYVLFFSISFLLSFWSYFLVWLVSLCSRTRYVGLSLALAIHLRLSSSVFSLSHSLWPHNLYLSRIRNQDSWVEKRITG